MSLNEQNILNETVVCINCGIVTKRHTPKTRFCGYKCLWSYRSKQKRGKNNKIFAPVNCKICNKEFTPISKANIYCSDLCKNKADVLKRSNKPKHKSCKLCNKEFIPYTSLDKFCSADCRIENAKSKRSRRWNKESTLKRKGENNPAWRGGVKLNSIGMRLFQKNCKSIKADIVSKNGFLSCEKCGASNVEFDCHHIIYRSEKPNHEHIHCRQNIIVLCRKCHTWFHQRKGNRNELVEGRKLHLLFGNDVLDKN